MTTVTRSGSTTEYNSDDIKLKKRINVFIKQSPGCGYITLNKVRGLMTQM